MELQNLQEAYSGVWTLEKIVWAIKNNLENGLKTTVNYTFSIEQLENTVIAERNLLVQQLLMQKALDYTELLQEINCIELDCKNFSLCCNVDTKRPMLHFELPIMSHIDFIGTVNRDISFKIYDDKMFIYDKYKPNILLNRPYVTRRKHEGVEHFFLFNPPTHNLKYISVSGVLENPLEVNKYSCCSLNSALDKFPMPGYLVNQLIDSVTQKWATLYYRLNYIPNTQQGH